MCISVLLRDVVSICIVFWWKLIAVMIIFICVSSLFMYVCMHVRWQSYNCGHDEPVFETATRIATWSKNKAMVYYSASGAWVHTYHTYIYTCSNILYYIHTFIHAFSHTYTHKHIHTCKYIYTYIKPYIHGCRCPLTVRRPRSSCPTRPRSGLPPQQGRLAYLGSVVCTVCTSTYVCRLPEWDPTISDVNLEKEQLNKFFEDHSSATR